MSLVNLVAALLIPIAFWLKFNDLIFILFGLILCVIIWWRHSENIKRLLAGKENPIKL
jgi:glycerol-3-phosphate acyltransferase PlsY